VLPVRTLVIAWLVSTSACGYPPLPRVNDGGGDPCTTSSDCKTAGFAVCDRSRDNGTCVQCTDVEGGACSGGTPACVNDSCAACTAHSQCASHACLPGGACADATQVAYVRPGGAGATCTVAQPCQKVSDAVKTGKSIVKVEGMVTEDMSIVVDGRALQIVADPGSRLTRTGSGVILDVKNTGADLRVSDLEITGGMGLKTDATLSLSGSGSPTLTLVRVQLHDNQGVGIVAGAGVLTVTQSVLARNAGGGISITSAQFDITNSFITGNGTAIGSAATSVGGIALVQADTGTRRIQFNTIADNSVAMSLVAGVNCTIAQSATFSNNIVWNNTSGTSKLQIGGNCLWLYSDIGDPAASTPPPGTGNLGVDPSFATPGIDYHLTPLSPARNAADPAATLAVDIDGDARPQDGRSDMGADELRR